MAKLSKELKIIIPEWFIYARNESLFNADEVAIIFGTTRKLIYSRAEKGIFPSADKDMNETSGFKKRRIFWSKETIQKEIDRLNNNQDIDFSKHSTDTMIDSSVIVNKFLNRY